jgi:hypothetical protein
MIRSSFATLAAVLVAVPLVPARAMAAPTPTPTAPTLTWAVQPANQQGPDGRRWIAHTLDPGQVVTERLAVRNFSNRAAVFALKAADGYLTDNGRFNMLPSGKASVDGGTWIQVQDTVSVGANETKIVPFTITVPREAKPGDHPAGIAATVTATGGTVAVESRVGFRVMMRVSGTVTAALTVDDLTATYRHSWNPFAPGSIRVRYATRNDGSVAVTGTGQVATAELGGLTESGTRSEVEQTLPGGSRRVDVRVKGVWGLGPLRTTVTVTPAVLDGDTSGAEVRPASASVTVWTLPWPQLLLVAILVAAFFAARIISRRRRQRLAELLARARNEGRAEARSDKVLEEKHS